MNDELKNFLNSKGYKEYIVILINHKGKADVFSRTTPQTFLQSLKNAIIALLT